MGASPEQSQRGPPGPVSGFLLRPVWHPRGLLNKGLVPLCFRGECCLCVGGLMEAQWPEGAFEGPLLLHQHLVHLRGAIGYILWQ